MKPNIDVVVGGPVRNSGDVPCQYKTKVLKPSIPFASQVTEPGYIYVIKWDFDLGGETVTIPENCILKFDGGSITNGTITGQHTVISADLVQIFDQSTHLAGSWTIEYAHPEWFGAKGDGTSDDTDAFYTTLSYFTSIFLRGSYSIDFRDIKLSNKAIVGKWRTSSVIIQRNSNVPFALIGQYNKLTGFTFRAQNNTQPTDILHFGYANGEYNSAGFTDITNMAFTGKMDDDYTIPFHFYVKGDGSADLYVENVRMYHCLIGMWFEFEECPGAKLQWLTEHTFKDITIYNPKEYGLKWGALSMRNQGKKIDGQTHQTMWCYDNRFENIGVDLVRPDSVGFYLGQGMGSTSNLIVFNDLVPESHGVTTESVGYSAEFAPIDSPERPKMFTEIVGGHWEGRIKNLEYAYMNIIRNVGLSLRDRKSGVNTYDTLDVSNLKNVVDVNIFGSRLMQYFTLANAKFSVGEDEFGEYVRVTRIRNDAAFGLTYSFSRSYLASLGLTTEDVYTIQSVVESNRGTTSSGKSVGGGYAYDVVLQTGGGPVEKSYDGNGYQDTKIVMSHFIKLTEESSNAVWIHYGGPVTHDDAPDYSVYYEDYQDEKSVNDIKIYDIKWLKGIIGYYLGYYRTYHERVNIQINESSTYTIVDPDPEVDPKTYTLDFVFRFGSAGDLYSTAATLPDSAEVSGLLPEIAKYGSVTFSTLCKYRPKSRLTIPLNGTASGVMANCVIDTSGVVTIQAVTSVADNRRVIGLYGNADEVIDAFKWSGDNEYLYRFPKAISKDGTPVGDANFVERDIYGGINTDQSGILTFNNFQSTRFGLVTRNQGNLQVKYDTTQIQLQKDMTKAQLADKVLLKDNIMFESGQQVYISDEGTDGTPCSLVYSKADTTTLVGSRYSDSTVIIQQDDTIKLYFYGKVISVSVHTGDTVEDVFSAIRDALVDIFSSELVEDITTPITQADAAKWYIGQMSVAPHNYDAEDPTPDPATGTVYVKYVNRDGVYNFSGGVYVLHSINDLGLTVKTCLDDGQDFKVVKASGELVEKFWV